MTLMSKSLTYKYRQQKIFKNFADYNRNILYYNIIILYIHTYIIYTYLKYIYNNVNNYNYIYS